LHKAWREEVMPAFTLDFLPPIVPSSTQLSASGN
jgi:hypothetical protein